MKSKLFASLLFLGFLSHHPAAFAAFPISTVYARSTTTPSLPLAQKKIPNYSMSVRENYYVTISQVCYLGGIAILIGAIIGSLFWFVFGCLAILAGLGFAIAAVANNEPGSILNLVSYAPIALSVLYYLILALSVGFL